MRNFFSLFCFISCLFIGNSQDLSPGQILAKSISYHDPNGVWGSFEGSFNVRMDTPERTPRLSEITMNQNEARFRLHVRQGEDEKTYELNDELCTLHLNGREDFSEADAKTHRLTCESAKMYRDYYSYLYGLPMKLRDKGTNLSPVVETRTFKGKKYLVLKVTYDKNVGEDTWYFYFDPATYAMEVYQFFHDESKNDGEYILLSGLESIGSIKMPKVRAWHYNKDDKYLGTDVLAKPGESP
jgi:hypothetical protein